MNEQLRTPEDQTNTLLAELMAPRPIVVGIEGGPCSGKTTLITHLAVEADKMGREVLVLPEAATQHIAKLQENGIDPAALAQHDRPGWIAFETDVMRTIHDQIVDAQRQLSGSNAIIVADRCDIGAYLTSSEQQQVLSNLDYAEPPLTELVDQLYFLPTVARESTAKYEALRATNGTRYESADAAIATCQANLQSISTHPELHVAWGGEFDTKIKRMAASLLHAEVEGEIKFGVRAQPAEIMLQSAVERGEALNATLMHQSYHQYDDQEFRLRAAIGKDAQQHYFLTVKTGEGAFRQELQRKITDEQYRQLFQTRQLGKTLVKMRYSFLEYDDEAGRRLWHLDKYLQPELDEWHLETDVHDQTEHDNLELIYGGVHRRIQESAKALIFK